MAMRTRLEYTGGQGRDKGDGFELGVGVVGGSGREADEGQGEGERGGERLSSATGRRYDRLNGGIEHPSIEQLPVLKGLCRDL